MTIGLDARFAQGKLTGVENKYPSLGFGLGGAILKWFFFIPKNLNQS